MTTLQQLSLANANRESRGSQVSPTTQPADSVDFSSNDCFGFARSKLLKDNITLAHETKCDEIAAVGGTLLGSTGCRLLTGNTRMHEEVETMLATHYGAPAALLFNSGFDLNLGFFQCVPQVGTTVVMDELMHASARQGMLLSRGTSKMFKHNDVDNLCSVLEMIRSEQGQEPSIIVVVESVYSMDGDVAPLNEICDVADKFGADVVVDEAHGTGVLGDRGRGVVVSLGLEERVLCRMHTFGKALGVQGAVVVGSHILKEYLLNNAKPIIFSASLPLHSLVSIMCAHEMVEQEASRLQQHLQHLIQVFQNRSTTLPSGCVLTSKSPVQGIIVPGNKEVAEVARRLRERGFHVLPIFSPVVPQNTERIRVILHCHNTEVDVNNMMDAVHAELQQLRNISRHGDAAAAQKHQQVDMRVAARSRSPRRHGVEMQGMRGG